MHLTLTAEGLLTQLGYTQTAQSLAQMKKIVEKTSNFSKFSPHIPSFNDALAIEKAYIAMSNSYDYLKIKCNEDTNASNLTAFNTLLQHWEKKYKLKLEKVENKNTYYLLGVN